MKRGLPILCRYPSHIRRSVDPEVFIFSFFFWEAAVTMRLFTGAGVLVPAAGSQVSWKELRANCKTDT